MAKLQQQQQRLQHADSEDDPKKRVGNMSSEVPSFSSPAPETPPAPAPLGPTTSNGTTTPGPSAPPAMPVLLPSFSAAAALVSSPYSCLVMDVHRRHIALSPMFLKKKRSGIQQELDTELLRYSESLHGVPFAYDDIRIVGQHGDIYDDSGYIHLDIQANFVVFQPTEGQRLLGTVNKLGATYVGCLVHGAFNASIPKPSLVSVDVWRDAGPRIGSDLEFEVSQLDADTAGVLLIRGCLDRTRVQEMLALGESMEVQEPADETLPPVVEPEPPGQDSTDQTPKKKKKKKKKESAEEDVMAPTPDQQTDADATQELNGAKDGEEKIKKKKKKKKEKHLEEETEEHVEPSAVEVHNSDSSGYLSDKPSKKRKAQEDGAINGDPETPKSKKKRKSGIQQAA